MKPPAMYVWTARLRVAESKPLGQLATLGRTGGKRSALGVLYEMQHGTVDAPHETTNIDGSIWLLGDRNEEGIRRGDLRLDADEVLLLHDSTSLGHCSFQLLNRWVTNPQVADLIDYFGVKGKRE